MKRLVVVLAFLLAIPASASHIVGGEIEFLYVSGFTYRINLIYYYDVINSNILDPRVSDPQIFLGIFRKSDNRLIRTVTLDWLLRTRVPYTQPECSEGEIITDKIIYTGQFDFTGDKLDDPQGYYITWARCCRNYQITNIHSEDPANGQGAGQTFYREFPPMIVNGKPFINSSPKNFPALADYACPTKPYYVDFAGTDPDGDSLAYSLVTPLSTVTVDAYPPIRPEPYPNVQWVTGFGLDRIVNGSPPLPAFPDLNITPAGFLRLTPRLQGLYVFAVEVDEFRNGVKIGETRRDFQVLVTDCKASVPPKITGKTLTAASYTSNQISLHFDNTAPDSVRCFMVRVTDGDADKQDNNFTEYIGLRVIAMNFKPKAGTDLQSILPTPNFGYIVGGGRGPGELIFKICLPACPFFSGGAYQIGILAHDDACPLPMLDTLRVNVDIQPPQNSRVRFNPPKLVAATLDEGTQDQWDFEAHDADGDALLFYALPDGFSLEKSGMKITSNLQPGLLSGNLHWDAFCDIYDFTKRTNFNLRLLVDDVDKCDLNPPDTLTYNLAVLLPPYPKPTIDTDLTSDPAEVKVSGITKKIYDNWNFNVTTTDIVANAQVAMQMKGNGFNPSDYGIQFTNMTGVGTVSSPFHWDLLCDKFSLEGKDQFDISFIAIDSLNKCRLRQVDSLVVSVQVFAPDNSPPVLSVLNLNNGVAYNNGNAVLAPGQELNLQLDVTDTDTAPKDNLTLKLVNTSSAEPLGWAWQDVTGPSVLTGTFVWVPLCSVFADIEPNEAYERNYSFDFQYADDRCITAVSNKFTIHVKVKDAESTGFESEPPNVFTPNGDGINDYYAMIRRDESGELINILPPDNCQGAFENIRIYNRWGKEVFTSGDRDFKWYGSNDAAGVYFYHVVFTNKQFKGTVSLRD